MTIRKRITEEEGLHEAWYVQAKEVQTPDQLKAFATALVEEYDHDYGTVVHACAATAVAACWAISRSNSGGGITGFQAGCVMWAFLKRWLSVEGPLRLVEYRNMLYPQYAVDFAKSIDAKTWKWLQDEAKKKLKADPDPHGSVVEHWRSIVAGKVPFGYEVKES